MVWKAFDVESEKHVHGSRWAGILGGYFSDPEIARPLVDALQEAIKKRSPTVLVDIGGGTGFILSELSRIYSNSRLRLIDLDISATQLSEERYENIIPIHASAQNMTREELCGEGDVLMLTMRSVLQYLGRLGAAPFLKHLASLLKPGECMVHQTACYENEQNVLCLNKLTELMKIEKESFSTSQLVNSLRESGWKILDSTPAAPLEMGSSFLAERYHLTKEAVLEMGKELAREFRGRADSFVQSQDGFTIRLDYRIFTSVRKDTL